jgi:ATP-dependent helicase Lhr and Lhr-like helicase
VLSSPPSFFHPQIRAWFAHRFGVPTAIQDRAWPVIAEGRHALITAPTGSGKTLTAFLWALDRLLTGAWSPGAVRVLYVSPLKALNADIERNLATPLAELLERFRAAGDAVPEIRAATRSGDTPPNERQRMLRRPPEILITTPESLNILLTSRGGRRLLGGLATVILDEIHAVAGSKRGTHLITAVDRLVRFSGEFQRIGISATVRPLERVAEFVGGYRLESPPESPAPAVYRRRPVEILRAPATKEYRLQVRAPAAFQQQEENQGASGETFWPLFAAELRRIIRGNRSTLLFANSRRLTEKITRQVNHEQAREVAYSHHGSLSKEIRSVVEQRLKAGELPAIISTSSLELGIDIGALDEVVLVQTPPGVAAAVQRLGRAGHGVGEVSRGRLYPLHDRDFIDAAVVARAVLEGDIEEVHPIQCPLDVLAQVVLSMVCEGPWPVAALYRELRTSAPYHSLPRRHLELVLEMLAGRYADSRIRDLKPRLSYDRVDGTVEAHRGAERLLYTSGGTIPDRGYFHLRLADSKAKLGELDEEFVWERSVGDTFTLGAQNWRVEAITHNDVLVVPARGAAALAPFWRAEQQDRGAHLSERIAEFLEEAERRLDDPTFRQELGERHALAPEAAAHLLDLLRRQRQVTGRALPHRHHLLVEHYADPYQGVARRQIILHTLWGGRVNRPFAIALQAAWQEAQGHAVEVLQDDDCINLILPEGFDGEIENLFDLVPEAHLEELLRQRLESTGFFGARFRENAARALLLPRGNPGRRLPLWLNRVRSKKLLETVSRYGDFPMVLETWRTCLEDELDLATLRRRLEEVRRGEVRITETHTQVASPFAANLIWTQTNKYMYEDDTPEGGRPSALRPDLLKELVFSSRLRPTLDPALVRHFEAKVQRTAPGYTPRSGLELRDWLEERVLIPGAEWRDLVAAIHRDQAAAGAPEAGAVGAAAVVLESAERAVAVVLPGGVVEDPPLCAVTVLPRLLAALELEPEAVSLRGVGPEGAAPEPPSPAVGAAVATVMESWRARGTDAGGEGEEAPLTGLLAEWLRFYGPLPPQRLAVVFGLGEPRVQEVLEALVESRTVVVDTLIQGFVEGDEASPEVCDSENLEILLRLRRTAARPAFDPQPIEALPLFLAHHQGLVEPGDDLEGLQERLDKLLGFPAPAAAWEGSLLPARMVPYYPAWLDTLTQESELQWLGCGRRRLTFTFPADVELLVEGDAAGPEGESDAAPDEISTVVFPPGRGRFGVEELALASQREPRRVLEALWQEAWRGRATSDTFLPVRRAIEGRFQAPEPGPIHRPQRSRGEGRRARRLVTGGAGRWAPAARPYPGLWSRVDPPPAERDALEEEELNRDRVRLLLDRYGVLFRELLARELPPLQWSRLFRSLRLMELSGEVLAGHFFTGISGLQFASPTAFRRLRGGLSQDAVYWFGAQDPISPCGLDLEVLRGTLPPRRATTYLVYQGVERIVTALRRGRELEITVPPEHPRLPEYLGFLRVLLGRQQHPMRAVEVESINGEPAATSRYLEVLRGLFSTTREARSIKLRKRYDAGSTEWPKTH